MHRRPMAGPVRYDAFLSYSRRESGALAGDLKLGLERLGKRWYRRRALRVFLDVENLTASVDGEAVLQRKLDSSNALVVLASPGAASSTWVAKEIAHWTSDAERATRTHLVLAAGQVQWKRPPETGFDPERTTALPDVAMRAFRREPFWIDLSWATDDAAARTLESDRWRRAVAAVSAAIRGGDADPAAILDRDSRERRRALRTFQAVGVTLALLLLGLLLEFLRAERAVETATRARAEADDSRAVAEHNLARANRSLGAAYTSASRSSDEAAGRRALFAARGVDLRDVPEARGALLRSLPAAPRVRWVSPVDRGPPTAIAMSDDGRSGATAHARGEILLWDLVAGRSLHLVKPHTGWIRRLVFDRTGSRLLSGDEVGTVAVTDLRTATSLSVGKAGDVAALAWSPDGDAVWGADTQGAVSRWRLGGQRTGRDSWQLKSAVRRMECVGGGAIVLDVEDHVWRLRPGEPPTSPVVAEPTSGLFATSDGGVGVVRRDGTASRWNPAAARFDRVTRWRVGATAISGLTPRGPVGLDDVTRVVRLIDGDEGLDLLPVPGRGGVLIAASPKSDTLFVANGTDLTVCSALSDVSPRSFLAAGLPNEVVLSVEWAPDGSVLYALARSGRLIAFDGGSGAVRWSSDGQAYGEAFLAVAPSGGAVATCSQGGMLRLHSSEDGRVLRAEALGLGPIAGLHFGDDRELWIATEGGAIRRADAGTGVTEVVGSAPWRVFRAFVAPDRRSIVMCGFAGELAVYDVGHRALRESSDGSGLPIRGAAFLGEHHIATAGQDGAIRVWSTPDLEPVRVVPSAHSGGVYSIEAAPALGLVATAGIDGRGALWRVADLVAGAATSARVEPLTELQGHEAEIDRITFRPSEGGAIEVATGGHDRTVRVWDLRDALMGHGVETAPPMCVRIVLDPATGHVAAAGMRATAAFVDDCGRCLIESTGAPGARGISAICVTKRSGRWAVGGFGTRLVHVWTGRPPVLDPRPIELESNVTTLVVDEQERLAIGREDGVVELREDWREPGRVPLPRKHGSHVVGLAFVPGAHEKLVSISTDHKVLLWDLTAGSVARSWSQTQALVALDVSPDGRWIVAGGVDRIVGVYPIEGPAQVPPITGLPPVVSLRFITSDLLAVGGFDGTIRIFSLESRELVGSFVAHRGSVGPLVLGDDARSLWSAGFTDRTVRRWNVSGLVVPAGNCQTVAEEWTGLRLIEFGSVPATFERFSATDVPRSSR